MARKVKLRHTDGREMVQPEATVPHYLERGWQVIDSTPVATSSPAIAVDDPPTPDSSPVTGTDPTTDQED